RPARPGQSGAVIGLRARGRRDPAAQRRERLGGARRPAGRVQGDGVKPRRQDRGPPRDPRGAERPDLRVLPAGAPSEAGARGQPPVHEQPRERIPAPLLDAVPPSTEGKADGGGGGAVHGQPFLLPLAPESDGGGGGTVNSQPFLVPLAPEYPERATSWTPPRRRPSPGSRGLSPDSSNRGNKIPLTYRGGNITVKA
ncbi:unnamed protein product, partial [Prorocentrum cordatum]